MSFLFETPRLGFRELTPNDGKSFFELNSDQEVIQWTGDNAFQTEKEAVEFLTAYAQTYLDHGMGRWAILSKETGDWLGWAGLKANPESGVVDLGFRLYKKYWNKGIATEAAKACLDYGFNTLGLLIITAKAHVENKASQHVLEKIGMTFWEDSEDHGSPVKVYRLINLTGMLH